MDTGLQRHAALPLHHLGYRLRFVDVAAPLPELTEFQAVAGVLSMLASPVAEPERLAQWLAGLDAGCRAPLPHVAIGHTGFAYEAGLAGAAVLGKLGVQIGPGFAAYDGLGAVTELPGLFGYEAAALPPPGLYDMVQASPEAKPLMQIDTRLGSARGRGVDRRSVCCICRVRR